MAGLLDLIGAATGVASLVKLFGDNSDPMDNPVLQQQLADSNTRRGYMASALDHNSADFKSLQAMNEERIKKDAVQAIGEVVKQHRMDRMRGYPGYFANPERRDETQSKTLASIFSRAGDTASKQAQDSLLQAAGTSTAPPASAGQIYALGQAQQQARGYTIPIAIGDTLKRGSIGLGLAEEPQTNFDKMLKMFSQGSFGSQMAQNPFSQSVYGMQSTGQPNMTSDGYYGSYTKPYSPYKETSVTEY